MEIERKWLIEAYPEELGEEITLIKKADVWQGYISFEPTVRIREMREGGKSIYVLCVKGKGTLSKEEVEDEISQSFFERLKAFTGNDLIHKAWRVYLLPTGEQMEVSLVDEGRKKSFYYAEVEFKTEEEAKAFIPPKFLGEEKTESDDFSMSKYWRKTRL